MSSGRLRYVLKINWGLSENDASEDNARSYLERKVYLKTAWGKLNLRSPGKLEVVDWNFFGHNRRI